MTLKRSSVSRSRWTMSWVAWGSWRTTVPLPAKNDSAISSDVSTAHFRTQSTQLGPAVDGAFRDRL